MPDPTFGGTNDVTELDIGQVGSPRHAANQARWIGRVLEGPEETAQAYHPLPGQNVSYRSITGVTGKKVTWNGTLTVNSDATLAAIVEDLNAKKRGAGTDFAEVRATRLTNASGRTLTERAVLDDWRFLGPARTITGGPFTLLVLLEIRFQGL